MIALDLITKMEIIAVPFSSLKIAYKELVTPEGNKKYAVLVKDVDTWEIKEDFETSEISEAVKTLALFIDKYEA